MYREFAPPAPIRELVRCVWSGEAARRIIVPDGCLDLIVTGGSVFVAGPDTRPWLSELPASTTVHGVRFHPGRAPSVLGVAADELRDQRVPITDLWPGGRGRAAADLLRADPSALTEVVAEHADGPADPEVAVLVRRLDAGSTRVSAAMTGLGSGPRQLRRRFTVAVGYGPATYLRVARFRRALALAGRTGDLAGLAAGAGYADQPHLARDCRQLTGQSPREYFSR